MSTLLRHHSALLRAGLLALVFGLLLLMVLLPLWQVVIKSTQGMDGKFVGLANFAAYARSPALFASLFNSLWLSVVSATLAVGLGFVYAYALTRARLPAPGFWRGVAMAPLFGPTLLHGICLVALFGNQGVATRAGFTLPLYGPLGIVLVEFLYTFPQAVLLISTALRLTDGRLYEASGMLGAGPWRQFVTVTLPGVRYGLMGAGVVCFTLAFTDFGGPKVVGGNTPVLATEIYKQVIGQQNFNMGATVSVVLLLPALGAFFLDQWAQKKQSAAMTPGAVAFAPRPHKLRDGLLLLFCLLMALALLGVLLAGLLVSLAKSWPYDLSPTLRHYTFQGQSGGYSAFFNSIRMSALTAVAGTALVFGGAYLIEKGRGFGLLKKLAYGVGLIPLALPGLVLGLAYILFFNSPKLPLPGLSFLPNPFTGLYGGMALLVLCNIAHFYTVAFFTCTTALKQLDNAYEAAAESLGVPFWVTFWRVTLPLSWPALVETALYFFTSALTTVSAVIFLVSPALVLASVSVVKMEDAGDRQAAAAMCLLITLVNALVRLLSGLFSRKRRVGATAHT